jgi:hypothetical protein
MEVTGYKFNTEQEAIDARKACADYYGLPKTPTNTTLYWVDYNEATLDNPIFWYIQHYEGVEPILGQPIEFNVTQEDI